MMSYQDESPVLKRPGSKAKGISKKPEARAQGTCSNKSIYIYIEALTS